MDYLIRIALKECAIRLCKAARLAGEFTLS